MDGGAETIRYPQQMVPRITIKEVLMIHTEEDPTSKVVDMLLEGLAVTKSYGSYSCHKNIYVFICDCGGRFGTWEICLIVGVIHHSSHCSAITYVALVV